MKVSDYDYWLIVWHTVEGDIIAPVNFQKGVHPKEYCESVMAQPVKQTGRSPMVYYKGFTLRKLALEGET